MGTGIGWRPGLVALTCSVGLLAAARAQDKADPQPEPPSPSAPKVDPVTIWPGTLARLAGRYRFAQVASPGGLWEATLGQNARPVYKQVSINEVPAALRDRLLKAELRISDLKLPSEMEAEERESPSKRGKLRYFNEKAEGTLVMHHLPGIGAKDQDPGDYEGRVEFRLEHRSHSNPSVSGIFQLRSQQEMTWGAATIDYADLTAVTLLPPAAPAAPGGDRAAPGPGGTGKPAAKPQAPKTAPARPQPARPAGPGQKPSPRPNDGKPHPEDEEDEGDLVIGNARVLRSAVEIFAYLQWRETSKGTQRDYTGCVRLFKVGEPAPPLRPPMPITGT